MSIVSSVVDCVWPKSLKIYIYIYIKGDNSTKKYGVCRDAEPEPTEGSVDIEVRHIYECIYENISYRFNLIF